MKADLLRAERIKRGWTQARVAEAVGVDARTVGRWERGKALPYPYFRQQLCLLFGKTAQQLGLLSADENTTFEDVASFGIRSPVLESAVQSSFLADPSMPRFLESTTSLVGRHGLLMEVKERLLAGENVALRAVDGLPGIGKTALAAVLAMDQRVRDHFCDGILWAGLGPRPNVLGHLARWGMLLGVMPSQMENISSRESWGQALRTAIGSRRLLLIISDAWTVEDVMALQIGGIGCAHVVTTHLSEVALAFEQEGAIMIAPLEESERIDLLGHLVPDLVEQDPQGALALVQEVGGLPLALTLMGSYLACQASSVRPHPLQRALALLRDTKKRLCVSPPSRPEEDSASFGETMLSLRAVIAVCDQQLSPQAHAALCALAIFLPKPESFSQEAALAVTQQPVETLDVLCDAGLLEVWGLGRYFLHQAVADYIYDQDKVSALQEQEISSLLENDVQVHKPSIHMPERPRFLHLTLQNLRPRMSSTSTFGPFKRFPSRSLLISSTILLTVLVIITMLPVFNMFFPHNSAHRKDNDTYAPPSYKLLIPSTESSFQTNVRRIQSAFNAVYPQLVNRFALNPSTVPKMMILTQAHSSSLSSPVSISGTIISISPDWAQHLPSDIGLLTHALTLFVEQYPSGAPAWFSNGLADYARSVYGPADDDNWSLPNAVQPTESYRQGGKAAAGFLLWLEQHARLDIADQLNHALQTRQSFSVVFPRLTHHTVDELWSQYQKDPTITLTPDQLYKTVTSRKPLYRSASLSIQASQLRTKGLSAHLGGLALSNFAIQVDMTILAGDIGGIIFRNNASAHYRFHLALDGRFDFVNQTNLELDGFNPAIREGLNQTNRITIIAQKQMIYVYINGQLIVQVDGNSVDINGLPAGKLNGRPSSYGTVALMAYARNDPTVVRFENVEIF